MPTVSTIHYPDTPAVEDKKNLAEHDENYEHGTNQTQAHLAHQLELEETPLTAVANNKQTVVWIVYAVWILITCSFDNQASGSILGIPQFRKDFGYAFGGDYVLPAQWQSAYNGGPAAASVIGAFGAGWVTDRIGRKLLIGIAYVVVMIGITLEVIAHTQSDPNAVFFAGKFINGIAVGGLITTVMAYVGELAPTALRGISTAACALAFTSGPFAVSFILNAYGALDNEWAYKGAFVAQYAITGIGLLIWPFMPESPTWLIVKNRDKQALNSLAKLGFYGQRADARMALIKLTLAEAEKESAGATYAECFRRSNLRPTIIAAMPLSIQAFSGIFWVAGYATYYFQLAGFSTSESFKLGIIQQVASILGNLMSWYLVERFGRRFLNLWGLIALTGLLWLTGGLATLDTASGNKATSALIIVYCWLYNVTIGATAYVAMSEVATSRLRAKTAAIALLIQQCWGTFWSFILPFIFNPDKGNLGGKTAFIFAAQSIVCCVYFYFYHPETKGRTYEELDEMFAAGIPARKFASYTTQVQRAGEDAKDAVASGRAHI